MPAGQGNDAERFAAALEQGTLPGFAADDDLARELEIVAMLRSSGAALAPDPAAKARAKQQLMALLAQQSPQLGDARTAITPPSAAEQTAPLGRFQDVAAADRADANATTARMAPVGQRKLRAPHTETAAQEPIVGASRARRRAGRHSVGSRPVTAVHSSRPAPSGIRKRMVLTGSAAMVMMVVLAVGAIFASRDALPGDNLYAVKRAAESAELALTFDSAAKARRQLELAATRLAEMEQLVERSGQAVPDPELFTSGIEEFDAAAGEASRVLLAAEEAGDTEVTDEVRSWASDQVTRLTELRPALPLPAATGADGAVQLLERLVSRAQALELRSLCSEVTSGAVDDLGPVPADGACAPRVLDRSDPDVAGSSGTEDETTTPDSDGSTGADDPTVGDPPDAADQPGLLPDVVPPGTSADPPSTDGSEGSSDTSESPSSGDDSISVPAPLPLLPPITLPPLLPGIPGITIG